MYNVRARGITKDGKPIFSEFVEHCVVADWLRANGIFFIYVPNEGKRSWATGKKLKRMGMHKGVADFLIFDPPPLFVNRWPKGTVLELKALDGDEPTQDQYEFMSEMGARGYAAHWWRGADAAVVWLESLGYGGGRSARSPNRTPTEVEPARDGD